MVTCSYMRKTIARLALGVALGGCFLTAAHAADTVIGFTSNGFQIAALAEARDGAMEEAKKKGVRIDYITAKDAADQQRAVESLIAKHVSVIAIDPLDAVAISESVRAANEAGIPVVMWVGSAKEGKVAATVLSDEMTGGYDIAKWTFAKMSSGKFALLQGDKGHQAGALREKGVRKALTEFPAITMSDYGEAKWNRDIGARVADNFLTRTPDLKAIIALNDEMAFGAIAAMEARQWPQPMIVTGYNGQCDALKSVLEGGKLSATLYQPFRDIGAKVVDLAVDIVAGKQVDQTVMVPSIVVDPELAKKALDETSADISSGLRHAVKRAAAGCKS
ncbi:MAG: sugar ABC transporter substrate-binding protein [Rhizobiales bacterium]|nr:sugar ABC transporter substrate-binding protein [Hyphomicrobiales bacterium]